MASNFKGLGETVDTYLFHQGLIKILIMHELQWLGRSWGHFLCLKGFEASTMELEPSAMLQHTPSSRKGKEKVRNRSLRSSASPESEDEGQDAPLEPIYDFFSEPSLPQAEDKDSGLTGAPVEAVNPQEAEPFVAMVDKSSKTKKWAARRGNKKHKTEESSLEKGKPPKVPISRVTKQQEKTPKSNGGESPLIESMVASSLVELSTSSKKPVPSSLSRQPLASNAPLGRVTHNKAKVCGLAPSPLVGTLDVAFVDLGADDAMALPA